MYVDGWSSLQDRAAPPLWGFHHLLHYLIQFYESSYESGYRGIHPWHFSGVKICSVHILLYPHIQVAIKSLLTSPMWSTINLCRFSYFLMAVHMPANSVIMEYKIFIDGNSQSNIFILWLIIGIPHLFKFCWILMSATHNLRNLFIYLGSGTNVKPRSFIWRTNYHQKHFTSHH